jgi:hypothetical protein
VVGEHLGDGGPDRKHPKFLDRASLELAAVFEHGRATVAMRGSETPVAQAVSERRDDQICFQAARQALFAAIFQDR